jgi:hypothetical protein
VKTGADAGVEQVDLANRKPTTIADLTEVPPPHPIQGDVVGERRAQNLLISFHNYWNGEW